MRAPKHVIQYTDILSLSFPHICKNTRDDEHQSFLLAGIVRTDLSSKACDIISFAGAHGGTEPQILEIESWGPYLYESKRDIGW